VVSFVARCEASVLSFGQKNPDTEQVKLMADLGGMEIPLNPPRGRQQNTRLRDRDGVEAADFPEAFIVDEPLRKELK
jgi:N-acetylglucosamine-6-sulfatase